MTCIHHRLSLWHFHYFSLFVVTSAASSTVEGFQIWGTTLWHMPLCWRNDAVYCTLCWIRNTQPKAWNKWLEDKSFLETYIMALLARSLSWKAEQNNNNFQIVGFMYSNSSNKNLLGHFCLAFLVADVSKTRYIFLFSVLTDHYLALSNFSTKKFKNHLRPRIV